jgi:hypothetical protein
LIESMVDRQAPRTASRSSERRTSGAATDLLRFSGPPLRQLVENMRKSRFTEEQMAKTLRWSEEIEQVKQPRYD